MTDSARTSRLWPLVGTVVFTLTVPLPVTVLVPFLLSRWHIQPPFFGTAATRALGAVMIVASVPNFLDFLARFARVGRGTPAPVAPTRFLVVSGAFRYVRNPAYICVVAIVAGQSLVFGSSAILIYAGCLALAFHLFVLLYEEPALRQQFGDEYVAYCRQVRRWLPRITPAPVQQRSDE